jgi:hypothetical protein
MRRKECGTVETMQAARPAYEAPAVVYEAELEVRAGSPVGMPDPLNDLFENK